jgi:hypothetical protein
LLNTVTDSPNSNFTNIVLPSLWTLDEDNPTTLRGQTLAGTNPQPDENITINHGCGGGDCGGGSNSGGDDSSAGGDGGDGGGRESDGDIGCGRADDDGDDEDVDGSYGGGKSDSVTTVTGTVAMGLVVVAVAKATMMTLCQCTRVKRSTTQQVAAAVAAVDGSCC